MSENGYITGQVYEIKPLIITPDRHHTYGPGGGGGYSGGFGGWGLQEGPRRGTGGQGNIRDIALPNIMSELMNEQVHNQSIIDNEYNAHFQTIKAHTEHELKEKKNSAINPNAMSLSESIALEQRITFELIDTKKSRYAAIAPNLYGLYGQSPFFMMEVLPRQKMREFLNSGTASREALIDLYATFDDVYKSALELKALSLSIDIVADTFADMANRRSQAESAEALDNTKWHHAQAERLNMISLERDIHVQRLPEFLQTELVASAGSIAGLTAAQAMTRYRAALDHLAARKTAEIQPIHAPPPFASGGITITFPATNPKINPPLSKPELEALNELVYLQNHTAVGTKWLSYHDALLKSESARHLTAVSTAFSALVARLHSEEQIAEAKRVADEHRRIAEEQAHIALQNEAKRIADEQARIAAESERAAAEHISRVNESAKVANTFSVPATLAASQSLLITSTGTIAAFDGVATALQAAVRAAITAVTSIGTGAASGLVVGVAALIYPSKLANGELHARYAFSTPLSDIVPDEETLLGIKDDGGTIDLPVRITSRAINDSQSELIIVSTNGIVVPNNVNVVKALYDAEQKTYSISTSHIPPRTFTWTPIDEPVNSSTTLPAEQTETPVYAGAKVEPVTVRIDSFPVALDVSFDDFITVFPADSGLPPVYVMFRDRREDRGIATGTGEPVTAVWLGAASHGEGAPIPSQIADQLRGRIFRNFKQFREEFWMAVANDPELSKDFIARNIERMLSGKAPKTRKIDSVGKRRSFEIHHIHELAKGGAVYDIDNMRILTPKLHIHTHRENNE